MSTEDTMPSRSNESSSHSEEPVIELPENSMNDETTILPAVKQRREPTNGRYDLAASSAPRPDAADEQPAPSRLRRSLAIAAKATVIALVVLAWVSAFLLAIRSI